jgi:hypothetical protein
VLKSHALPAVVTFANGAFAPRGIAGIDNRIGLQLAVPRLSYREITLDFVVRAPHAVIRVGSEPEFLNGAFACVWLPLWPWHVAFAAAGDDLDRGVPWELMLTVGLSPLSLIRARVTVLQRALHRLHPMTAGGLLCDDDEFVWVARLWWYDASDLCHLCRVLSRLSAGAAVAPESRRSGGLTDLARPRPVGYPQAPQPGTTKSRSNG